MLLGKAEEPLPWCILGVCQARLTLSSVLQLFYLWTPALTKMPRTMKLPKGTSFQEYVVWTDLSLSLKASYVIY